MALRISPLRMRECGVVAEIKQDIAHISVDETRKDFHQGAFPGPVFTQDTGDSYYLVIGDVVFPLEPDRGRPEPGTGGGIPPVKPSTRCPKTD